MSDSTPGATPAGGCDGKEGVGRVPHTVSMAWSIAKHPYLISREKAALFAFVLACDERGRWRASNAKWAKWAGMSPRTLRRVLHGDEKSLGLIDGFGGIITRQRNFEQGAEEVSTFYLRPGALTKPQPRSIKAKPEAAPNLTDHLPSELIESVRVRAEADALRRVGDGAVSFPDGAASYARAEGKRP